MQQWEFSQDESGRWYWICHQENGHTAQSAMSFKTRNDCIADAMRHGYLGRSMQCEHIKNDKL
jgi:hypothetical protein